MTEQTCRAYFVFFLNTQSIFPELSKKSAAFCVFLSVSRGGEDDSRKQGGDDGGGRKEDGWWMGGVPFTSPSYKHVFWHHMRRSRRQTDTERRRRLRRRKVTRPAGKEDDKSPSLPTRAFLKHEPPPRHRPMRTGRGVSTSSPKIFPPSKDTGGAGKTRRRERRSAAALRLRQRESFKRFYPSNFREAGMEGGRTRDSGGGGGGGGGGGWMDNQG